LSSQAEIAPTGSARWDHASQLAPKTAHAVGCAETGEMHLSARYYAEMSRLATSDCAVLPLRLHRRPPLRGAASADRHPERFAAGCGAMRICGEEPENSWRVGRSFSVMAGSVVLPDAHIRHWDLIGNVPAGERSESCLGFRRFVPSQRPGTKQATMD